MADFPNIMTTPAAAAAVEARGRVVSGAKYEKIIILVLRPGIKREDHREQTVC